MFGDILTEVYGYAYDRRAVWCGFSALLFATAMSAVVIGLPAAPGEYNTKLQEGLSSSLATPGASVGIHAGVLVRQPGQRLRAGQDENLFARQTPLDAHHWLDCSWRAGGFVAFLRDCVLRNLAHWNRSSVWVLRSTSLKPVGRYWQPLTYAVVGFLKRRENQDHYDVHTDFNPFHVRV